MPLRSSEPLIPATTCSPTALLPSERVAGARGHDAEYNSASLAAVRRSSKLPVPTDARQRSAPPTAAQHSKGIDSVTILITADSVEPSELATLAQCEAQPAAA
ncbi:hypothetical protein CYMTET_5730 [Cymbomonas tetramitiformis]|uniref:Uncharacterized protein n=1 Tax=Cymbomonas tetramitiformis TaxID=36881 RepID=A0AAE0CA74_9CHLO|nr:hypothetical protein CYMTET_39355 [Cymbomonas tetramitiformis]KAK3286725.1 hypothetical protein CYMTET_5730 [Cymbomonas tetramitiformis]